MLKADLPDTCLEKAERQRKNHFPPMPCQSPLWGCVQTEGSWPPDQFHYQRSVKKRKGNIKGENIGHFTLITAVFTFAKHATYIHS